MIRKIFLSLCIAPVLAACSDIDETERFIPIDSVTPLRCVLLEDFTGQNCVNCPAAHEEIDVLVKQYPDALIPVSIHAGDFGISCTARRPGLMQPEGNTYNDRYGIDEWPKGVVNGRGGALNPGEWSDAVREELKRDANVSLDLSATADVTAGTIDIGCVIRPKENMGGTMYVWVIEDGIVARQVDKEQGLISDYVHNHVYRACVNGVDGESVSLQANIHKSLEFVTEIRDTDKEKWVPANLSIVAFIRMADGSVAQVARCKVVCDAPEE